MDIVVETLGNEIVSDWSFKGYWGAKNAGHNVSKATLNFIKQHSYLYEKQRPMPIGSIEYMDFFFDLYGMEKPKPLNIPSFMDIGRKFWIESKKEDINYPAFVKPLNEPKKFTGFVAKNEKDFDLYPELEDWDGPYFCSEPIQDEILSEWRWFILDRKTLNVSNYSGEVSFFPSINESMKASSIVNKYGGKLPRAITVDMGLTVNSKGQNWHIIELNRAYSTGPYGIDEDSYFKFLKADWNEMINKKQ